MPRLRLCVTVRFVAKHGYPKRYPWHPINAESMTNPGEKTIRDSFLRRAFAAASAAAGFAAPFGGAIGEPLDGFFDGDLHRVFVFGDRRVHFAVLDVRAVFPFEDV